jgi:pimeloyl-ACP methyl ester carboxylesterase
MAPALRSLLLLAPASLLSCAHSGPLAGPAPAAARPASPAAERFTSVDGAAGKLHVSDGGAGAGAAVILIHGLGSDLEVWRPQLDHLRAGRRAVAYDQRGHGQSEKARDGVYTIEALAADLEAVRGALGLEKVILVGHSMSGEVLTTYAGAHPERVAGLVYVDALGDASAIPREAVSALVARETDPAFGPEDRRKVFAPMLAGGRPATARQVLASLDRIDPPAFGLLRKSMLEVVDGPARLAPYRGPAVAVEAGDSPWPGSASARLGVRRVAIGGVCHWLQLDDPAALNRDLDEFLATLAP